MVNVTNDPFGNYGYVLGGGPGNYTGYGATVFQVSGGSPDDFIPKQSRIPAVSHGQSYRARLLHTTRLKDESQLPNVNSFHYQARGLNHQGQHRQRRNRLYQLPLLDNTSTTSPSCRSRRSTRTSNSGRCKTSPNQKQYSVNRNHIKFPEIATQTAGIRTIDTVCHSGFAKGLAASRADTGSLVNALRCEKELYVHSAGTHPLGRVSSIAESVENLTVLPRAYEDYYFTTLEKLKHKRLGEAYIRTFEQHRKNRTEIVKRKMYNADKVKRQNVLADQMTGMLLGIRREPIHIPTATMDREDDYANYFSKPKTLKSVEQARKNISGAYLNVWNSTLKPRDEQ